MRKIRFAAWLSAPMVLILVGSALAVSSYLTSFNSRYGTAGTALSTCNLCHPGGNTNAFNAYATAYAGAGHNFATIESLDSDGDGFTNIVEINARTFPGDPASHPVLSDTTAPTVTGFTIPATSASLTVSIAVFTATDNVAVTGYFVTESILTPVASAAGWTAKRPAGYTFASAGSKTLYAWAKDAADNVSDSLSAAVVITLPPAPDTTAPAVTGFTIPATSASLTVPITVFTATDNVAVTGYFVTESIMTPVASAAGWTATRPAGYTFASAGSKTLYAWAKDAAGNVSASLSAAVAITLPPVPDTTAPTVTGFTIPATSASLTVPITVFTATDNVAVTGYLVKETATAPAASAAGWTATRPAGYTFASAGSKILYAWAKDAAGNVSSSLSAAVAITLPLVPDTTAPTVTGFTIPATSASLTVPITVFTATDNVTATGYFVTESIMTPVASAADWTATAPASYTFVSEGSKILYAWAKDAAGNVSASLSAAVAITLPLVPDTTAPAVTGFTIPAASASLTVPITVFTATDNVAVTGYLVKETATVPAASAAGWTATAPASYTFASAGSKILYAWAKDAAGNVSASLNAAVVITLLNLQAPGVLSPTPGSVSVALSPSLQVGVSFPDTTGGTHKSTDWQISSDATFASGSMVFSSIHNATNLTSLVVPPGILLQGRTYYWRAGTTNSADAASPYSTTASFTTLTVTMDGSTGTLPDALAVKSGGVQVTNLSAHSAAALAAAGNISPQLVTGPNSVPLVNAGAGANPASAGMMIVKANGGVGSDVLGIVTPAGTVIDSVTTTATASNTAFRTAAPVGISLPYGIVSFRLSGITPGASTDVTLYTPADLPSGALWCKYSPTLGWLKMDATGTYDASGALVSINTRFNVVSGRGVLTIQDNDIADFSTELVAGKAIVLDPGGPGLPSTVGSAAGDGGGGGGCFIATAAFGSPLDPYVGILREFRDAILLTSTAGRRFVDFYYRVSPEIASRVGASETLRILVRTVLWPVIGLSFVALKAGVPVSLGLLLALLVAAGLAIRRYRRGRTA